MWQDDENEEKMDYLFNPSRTAMQELGRELRAMVDTADDLYVWRTEAMCHFEFAKKHNLTGKTWLYIDPAKALVTVSSYSHCGRMDEARQHVKAHPRFKFFTVDGLEEKKPDKVTDEDRALLQELFSELKGVVLL